MFSSRWSGFPDFMMYSNDWFGSPDRSFFSYHDAFEEDILNDSDSDIRAAVKSGSFELVKQLIGCDISEINMPDANGRTLLHHAVVSDEKIEITKLLISAGAIIDYRTRKGQSPLYIACKYWCEETVKVLIDAGCNVNSHTDVDDDFGRCHMDFTPLHIACNRRNKTIMKLLLENNANVNAKDHEGHTPLYFAMDDSDATSLNILIEAGADLNVENHSGFTPLHVACISGKLDILNSLLEHLRHDESALNHRCLKGFTSLMLACHFRQYFVAEKLIECGVDMTLVNTEGLLALHLAVRCGYKFFKLMLQHTPEKAIEKYASFGCNAPVCPSLPCYIIDFGNFQCLDLLYKFGLSQAVLKCTDESWGYIVSPIGYLILRDPPFHHDIEIKFLNFFLTIDFLMDPAYEKEYKAYHNDKPRDRYVDYPWKAISTIEAIFIRHRPELNHIDCICEVFLSMIVEKSASLDKILESSNEHFLFNKAAREGFIDGLELIKYALSVEPDDILEMLLEDIASPEYVWTGYEDIGVVYLLDRCTTNFKPTFLKIRDSLTRPLNLGQKYNGLFDVKAYNEVTPLQKMCRFTIRKYVRKQAQDSSQNFRINLSSLALPFRLSRYLLYEEDF